jgi:hypothetical protein
MLRLTDRTRVFAQGTPEDMNNLKGTLEKLTLDNEIKGRINKYHGFRAQLTDHDDSEKLRKTIRLQSIREDKEIGELIESIFVGTSPSSTTGSNISAN